MTPVASDWPGRRRPGSDLPVEVAANVGSVREAEAAAAAVADGIGLVRTELLFLGRSVPPGLDEQRAVYRRIAEALPGRRVVFRTLDIGGDKPAPYLATEPEMNPALGVRGIRAGLAHPDAVRDAAAGAARGDPRRTGLDPAADGRDGRRGRRGPRGARPGRPTRRRGRASPTASEVRLGVMIEVPSAALMADALAPVVDFFSIGTNDLVQYTLAADRTSAALADLASPLQPSVLRLVRSVVEAPRVHGRHVSVCGEAAADPLAAALFVGLGVDELSVAPGSIAGVRGALANARRRALPRGGGEGVRGGIAGGGAGDRRGAGRRRRCRSEARRPAGRSAASARPAGARSSSATSAALAVGAACSAGLSSALTSLRKSLMLLPSADPIFGRFFGPCQIRTITRMITRTMRTSEPMRGWYSLVRRGAGRRPG